MKPKHIYLILLCFLSAQSFAQLPPVFNKQRNTDARQEPLTRTYLNPTRILWKNGDVKNADLLLRKGKGQADLSGKDYCTIKSGSAVLLDYGKELHGGLQLITDQSRGGKPIKVRLRFGESAAEAMSELTDTAKNATNDHAMRDFVVSLPWLGKLETGNTGFRFVRIDVIDEGAELKLKEANAIFVYRPLAYLGSFNSSDTLLNKIWMTGAYTVQLNMQDYLWDGIKRDRLVWVGDMHPEVSTIAAVFGNNEVVNKSLDMARDITPLPEYMNGMVSYSMWWVLIQRDWYMHNGDLVYLKKQHTYLNGLLEHYLSKIDANNSEALNDGTRFLDWPSSEDKPAIHAGLQAMLVITLQAGEELSSILKDEAMATKCKAGIAMLKKHVPKAGDSKQAASLLALSGLAPAGDMDKILSAGGVHRYSTFFGYYMLQAKAKAGNYKSGIEAIKQYWGPMLQLGATTFWEDFDIDWIPNAARIDELVPDGKVDIHGTKGGYCYKGYRHSLSHGWASGPTAWLTEHVLGVKVLDAGCKKLLIEPHLGDLNFVEGTYPTPFGIVTIKHVKQANGKIKTTATAPKGVELVVKS